MSVAAANGAIRSGSALTATASCHRNISAGSPISIHQLLRALDELRGRDLVCFCAPRPCHGDLLLRLADPTREQRIAWWRAVKAAAPRERELGRDGIEPVGSRERPAARSVPALPRSPS
jgi:hypothetical protein